MEYTTPVALGHTEELPDITLPCRLCQLVIKKMVDFTGMYKEITYGDKIVTDYYPNVTYQTFENSDLMKELEKKDENKRGEKGFGSSGN